MFLSQPMSNFTLSLPVEIEIHQQKWLKEAWPWSGPQQTMYLSDNMRQEGKYPSPRLCAKKRKKGLSLGIDGARYRKVRVILHRLWLRKALLLSSPSFPLSLDSLRSLIRSMVRSIYWFVHSFVYILSPFLHFVSSFHSPRIKKKKGVTSPPNFVLATQIGNRHVARHRNSLVHRHVHFVGSWFWCWC